MIAFDLECSGGHVFEGWFKNNGAFEEQVAKKLVSCPYCNDTKVRKLLSPINVKTLSPVPVGGDMAEFIDYRRLAAEIVDYVNKNFHDVGTNFAKEALKIHYGVSEKRNIRGSATQEEEKVMKDEGIAFVKVPVPKIDDDEKN